MSAHHWAARQRGFWADLPSSLETRCAADAPGAGVSRCDEGAQLTVASLRGCCACWGQLIMSLGQRTQRRGQGCGQLARDFGSSLLQSHNPKRVMSPVSSVSARGVPAGSTPESPSAFANTAAAVSSVPDTGSSRSGVSYSGACELTRMAVLRAVIQRLPQQLDAHRERRGGNHLARRGARAPVAAVRVVVRLRRRGREQGEGAGRADQGEWDCGQLRGGLSTAHVAPLRRPACCDASALGISQASRGKRTATTAG